MLIVYLVARLVVFVCKSQSAQIAWVFSSEIMINMKLFSNLSKRGQKRIQEILIGGKVQTLSQKRPQKRLWANYFSPQFRHYPQQANLLKNNRRSCRYKNFKYLEKGESGPTPSRPSPWIHHWCLPSFTQADDHYYYISGKKSSILWISDRLCFSWYSITRVQR